MKVALVIASLAMGGAERVMSVLASHWAERGDDVTLITLGTEATDTYAVHPAVTRIALGLVEDSTGVREAMRANWRRVRELRRAIIGSGATAVLSFEDRTNVLVVLATLGLPVRRVISERTDPTRHEIGAAWRLLRRLTYPLAHALVVQTRRLLPWGSAVMLRRDAARAIPNYLRNSASAPAAAGEREPLVVSVGRLLPEKGHDVLLKAFARVAGEFAEWRLTIVGEGSQRVPLTELARDLGVGERVKLTGWLEAPEGVLARAGIFVMSSQYEGFSNALLEAIGAGLPVVTTACGGADEMVDAETNGFVVPVDDVDALSRAMRRLMSDPVLRQRMAASAGAVAQRYTPRAVMPLWDAVISPPCLPNRATKSYS
jgi:glycosyltransferase involved in cell wall biosynthesis